MNLDIIVAILGIISAIVGLLTAIIQLKNATHQRRHQESQDSRSYIDIGIGRWLKRALVLFGVPFAILLVYREWDSVEKGVWDFKGFADKAIMEEVVLSDISGVGLDPKKLQSVSTRYFRVRFFPDKDTYWGTCTDGEVFQGIAIQNENIRNRFSENADLSDGNVVIQGDSGSPTRNGGLVYIFEKKPRVYLDIRKKNHPGCRTDAPLKVSIQFIPESP